MNNTKAPKSTNDLLIEELIVSPDYDIRSDGSIWTKLNGGGTLNKDGVIRQAGSLRNGYVAIRYKTKNIGAHRIIYRKFVGQLDSSLVINHKNGNRKDNHPSNLELVTQSENMIHSYQVLNQPKGYPRQDDGWERAVRVRSLKMLNCMTHEIARSVGISDQSARKIINGSSYNYLHMPDTHKHLLDLSLYAKEADEIFTERARIKAQKKSKSNQGEDGSS